MNYTGLVEVVDPAEELIENVRELLVGHPGIFSVRRPEEFAFSSRWPRPRCGPSFR